MEHKYYKCEQPCEKPNCQYCDGGLAFCTVCKEGEGGLKPTCPGPKPSFTPVSDDLEAAAREFFARNEYMDFYSAVAYCKYRHATDRQAEIMAAFASECVRKREQEIASELSIVNRSIYSLSRPIIREYADKLRSQNNEQTASQPDAH